MKQKSAIFLTFLSILVLQCVGFKELHDLNDIMIHYEQTSSKPLIHAFYNRHFKNSTQFKEF